MKYLMIKNIPIVNLMVRKAQGGINWEKYGLNPNDIRRMQVQGKDNNEDYVTLLPISDEAILNNYINDFQNYAENTAFENDEISIIEQEEFELLKTEIEALKV
jgi:hypothetical protein